MNQKGIYEQLKDKTETKYKEQQLDLQKILSGKTTIGSIFSKGSKEDKITNMEKMISNVKIIIFLENHIYIRLKQKWKIFSSFAILSL